MAGGQQGVACHCVLRSGVGTSRLVHWYILMCACNLQELLDHLEGMLSNEPVEVSSGQAIVEVKPQVSWELYSGPTCIRLMQSKNMLVSCLASLGPTCCDNCAWRDLLMDQVHLLELRVSPVSHICCATSCRPVQSSTFNGVAACLQGQRCGPHLGALVQGAGAGLCAVHRG